MFTDVTDEIQKTKIPEPVIVVHEFRRICSGREIEEALHLRFHTFDIMKQHIFGKQIALCTFSGWITNHSGSAADQGNRAVATLLKMNQRHDLNQVTNVKGVGGRVESDIAGCRSFCQLFLGTGHDIMQHAAPFQLFDEVLHPIKFSPKIKKLAFSAPLTFAFCKEKGAIKAPFSMYVIRITLPNAHW